MHTKDENCPHDKLFKSIMADPRVASDFLKNYLPSAIIPLVDFKSLKLRLNTYVDEELSLRSTDVLYQANISGQQAYIYLLCEHQSYIDPLMPFRLWYYIFRIWDQHIKEYKGKGRLKKLPLIIPLVFYHGSKPWNVSKDLKDIIEGPTDIIENILFKPFHLIDTNKIEDETLRQQKRAGLMAFVMKSVFLRDFMKNKEMLYTMLINLIAEEGKEASLLIRTLLNYLIQYGNTPHPKDFISEIKKVFSTTISGSEFMPTVAEYLKEEGRQQGREEGRQQGELIMLQNQLKLRFGIIPSIYKTMIEKADSDTLLMWGARILRANTIHEIFEEAVLT